MEKHKMLTIILFFLVVGCEINYNTQDSSTSATDSSYKKSITWDQLTESAQESIKVGYYSTFISETLYVDTLALAIQRGDTMYVPLKKVVVRKRIK